MDKVVLLDLLWLGTLLVQVDFDNFDRRVMDHALTVVDHVPLESLESGTVVMVGFDDAYEAYTDWGSLT